MGVAAHQRVVRPRDPVDALLAHHLPLRPFERKPHPLRAPIRVDRQQMRMVLQPGAVRRLVEAGKTKDRPDQCISGERPNR